MSALPASIPRRTARRIGVAAAILVVSYLAVCGVILSMSLRGIRQPLARTPQEHGMTAEAVSFPSADGLTLRGYFFPAATKDRAVVKLHGLDGNCFDGATPDLVRRYVQHGLSVLVFDFRSQGSSDGTRLGLGWDERQDVRGAVDHLLGRGFKPGRLVLHGASYGAATALLSAAMIPEFAAVIADSAFADARDLMDAEIARRIGFSSSALRSGIQVLSRFGYGLDLAEIAPLYAVPRIAPRPIFFIHGDADERIPVAHTRRLKAASSNPRDELWLIPGAGHTVAFEQAPDAFFARVATFVDTAVPPERQAD